MDTNEEKNKEQNRKCESSVTPDRLLFCANTPKRRFLQHHISTPLHAIRERNDTKEEIKTPLRGNPFDVKAESLSFPSCSPSIFATFARNKSNKGTFRWSIEHLSFLYPADIDETSIPDPWVDPDQEVKAQKAIDTFFSQNSIVPSPWASDSSAQKCGTERRLRRMSKSGDLLSEGSNVATQTKLSIPPDVDLMALLGSYFTFEDGNEISPCSSKDSSSRDSDLSNTSSLRRKLFTANDDFTSPPHLERKDLYAAKQWCASNMRSLQSTPSDVLSSSPISPSNCSDFFGIPAISPHVSPIAARSRKSGINLQSFTKRLEEEEENMSVTSSKLSSQSMCTAPDNSMNFYMESQEAIICPSERSEKQDTGYITGNISTSHNITSEVSSGLPSHITPVAQLIKDWDISMSNTNNISYMNAFASSNNNTFDQAKQAHFAPCNYETWLKMPNFCSTPTKPTDL